MGWRAAPGVKCRFICIRAGLLLLGFKQETVCFKKKKNPVVKFLVNLENVV